MNWTHLESPHPIHVGISMQEWCWSVIFRLFRCGVFPGAPFDHERNHGVYRSGEAGELKDEECVPLQVKLPEAAE